MPKALNIAVRLDPLSYGVDSIRVTIGGASQFGLMTDFWVLVIVTAILISIGSYFFSEIQV